MTMLMMLLVHSLECYYLYSLLPFSIKARMNNADGRKNDKEVPAIVPMKEKTVEMSLITIAIMTSATNKPKVIA